MGSFRKLGVPYLGVLIIRILLFGVLYEGPLFPETPISAMLWRKSRLNGIRHTSSYDIEGGFGISEVSGVRCHLNGSLKAAWIGEL